jgi:hypothetical protein
MNGAQMPPEPSLATDGWSGSSRCSPNNDCVELKLEHKIVGVRDSKNARGPVLVFQRDEWTMFLTRCHCGTG